MNKLNLADLRELWKFDHPNEPTLSKSLWKLNVLQWKERNMHSEQAVVVSRVVDTSEGIPITLIGFGEMKETDSIK